MNAVNNTIVSYLGAWNETDPARRHTLVAQTWTEAGLYQDAHRAGTGHDEISAMIGTTQERFPGYRFRLVSGIEDHHGKLRFSWAAGGTPDAPLFFAGTDFAEFDGDGRFVRVIGFVDAMPSVG
jgi:hypothetical protein